MNKLTGHVHRFRAANPEAFSERTDLCIRIAVVVWIIRLFVVVAAVAKNVVVRIVFARIGAGVPG